MSTLDDGTPFRPSNTKSLNVTNLDLSRLNKYKQEFKQHDADNDGFLQGDQVKSIWMNSALDARSLGLIWNLCDPDNLGKLDMRGYVAGKKLKYLPTGMFLIDEKLRGVSVPSTLPSELLEFCG
jgi:epidermal growth factor receptor substrate 15